MGGVINMSVSSVARGIIFETVVEPGRSDTGGSTIYVSVRHIAFHSINMPITHLVQHTISYPHTVGVSSSSYRGASRASCKHHIGKKLAYCGAIGLAVIVPFHT